MNKLKEIFKREIDKDSILYLWIHFLYSEFNDWRRFIMDNIIYIYIYDY